VLSVAGKKIVGVEDGAAAGLTHLPCRSRCLDFQLRFSQPLEVKHMKQKSHVSLMVFALPPKRILASSAQLVVRYDANSAAVFFHRKNRVFFSFVLVFF
jgi:hypothetical protein